MPLQVLLAEILTYSLQYLNQQHYSEQFISSYKSMHVIDEIIFFCDYAFLTEEQLIAQWQDIVAAK